MKAIEPIQIWFNGLMQTGNYIDAKITDDNLKDSAKFYWAIFTNETDAINISEGELKMVEPDYSVWDATADINEAAYEWICDQLNLTLIP